MQTQTERDDALDFQDWLTSEATVEEVAQLMQNVHKHVYIIDDAIPEFESDGRFLSNVYITNVPPAGLQLAMRSTLAARYDTVAGIVCAEVDKSVPYGI